jgi:hypothetical protein
MAVFVNRLETKRISNRYTYSLIAGYLFMIYRGDLMSTIAYCFGTYVVMVYIPTKVTFNLPGLSLQGEKRVERRIY